MRTLQMAVLCAALLCITSHAQAAANYFDPSAYKPPHASRAIQSLTMPAGQTFDSSHNIAIGTVMMKTDPATKIINATMPDSGLVLFTGMLCDGAFGKNYTCKIEAIFSKGMKAPSCTLRVSQPTPPSTVVMTQPTLCPTSVIFSP